VHGWRAVHSDGNDERELESERLSLLARVEDWLETPMLVLGFVWLALLVVELVHGLSPLLAAAGWTIWGIFVLDFAVRFTLAPRKGAYLARNWLTAVSLFVPALRVFRVFRALRVLRAARAARGLRLLKVVSSLNRGMRALGRSMGRRGFGYVLALTAIVTLAGAAGMYAFERGAAGGGGITSYGAALWWTAMIMVTMGSEYWPRTAEGRVLCFLLALYAFGVFGYVTATIATFFVGQDAASEDAEIAGTESIAALRREITALREEIRALRPAEPKG
jgi:voltage-gated potassium channel